MPKITFIQHDGATLVVEGRLGQSLMEAAVQNNVPGIDADCGGACACGTCQVHVQAPWQEALTLPSAMETDMLSFTSDPQPCSRLACQITLEERHEGLVVRVPSHQH
jgi:2Fe-2S ferredoxin